MVSGLARPRLRTWILSSALFLTLPATLATAADAPLEAIFPADSMFYARWDGFDVHRAAFAQTELGKIFNEELRPLVDFTIKAAMESLGPGLQSEKLLEGAAPEELAELQNSVKELPDLLAFLSSHGLAIGAEMTSVAPPHWQITIVIPEGGNDKTANALFGALRLLAKQNNEKTTTNIVRDRKVLSSGDKDAQVAAFREGAHFVISVGSEPVEKMLTRLDDKTKPTLAGSEIFKQLRGFDRYTTYARGYVDTEKVFKVIGRDLPVAPVLEQLGAGGLKRFTFQLGFEGAMQRASLQAVIPRDQRKGALGIFGSLKPVSIEGLPPIAPDASYISASGIVPEKSYEYALDVGSVINSLTTGAKPDDLKKKIEAVEKELGVKFKEDLLSSLDAPVVVASTPSEGPFAMGTTFSIKVKDAKKLSQSLESLFKSIGPLTGADVTVTRRTYRGVELNMVHVSTPGGGRGDFPFGPTYTIHEGWLVVALYPQPVQGYIYRSGKGVSRWQPTPMLAQAIEAEKTYRAGRDVQIVGLGESDPRPTIKAVLGIAPFVAMIAQSFPPGRGKSSFDVSLIPNSQAVTERLKPGVTLIVDDGESIGIESYATLPLGVQLNGMDMYFLAFVPALLFRGF